MMASPPATSQRVATTVHSMRGNSTTTRPN